MSQLKCYHGSNNYKDYWIPTIHTRKYRGNIIFRNKSFHVTPYEWIAVVYTYNPKPFLIGGKVARVNVGVNLKEYSKIVDIYGINSLEYTLNMLYGDGGFITEFNKNDFFTTAGLGALELISDQIVYPENKVFR